MKPDFSFEKKLWKKYPIVIGVDEVGRGALAGPVVAGAVVFNNINITIKIDDSKRLTEKQREKGVKWIKKNCLAWAVGETSVYYINKFGIVKATEIAFRKAIKNLLSILKKEKTFLIVDAFYVKYVKGIGLKHQKAIIKGDQKSISIASASIIAKVYRDKLMRKLSLKFKHYGWDRNKGYGTKEHVAQISRSGISPYHRISFVSGLAIPDL